MTFGPHFSESFAKSQLQSPGYAPSIWLVFEKMSPRASRNEFLEVPIFPFKNTIRLAELFVDSEADQ